MISGPARFPARCGGGSTHCQVSRLRRLLRRRHRVDRRLQGPFQSVKVPSSLLVAPCAARRPPEISQAKTRTRDHTATEGNQVAGSLGLRNFSRSARRADAATRTASLSAIARRLRTAGLDGADGARAGPLDGARARAMGHAGLRRSGQSGVAGGPLYAIRWSCRRSRWQLSTSASKART